MSSACPGCAAPLDPDERFCGECGGYAGWSGQEPDTTTAHEPAQTPSRTQPAPPPPIASRSMPDPTDRGTPGPQPQQPDAPAAPPTPGPPTPPDDVPIRHGDLVCGACGAGNEASRKFCRRCGTTLAEAEAAEVPWWRRLFRRRPRRPRAGDRPSVGRRVRVPARLFLVLGLLAALGISGYVLRGYVVGGYDAVRDRISGVEARLEILEAHAGSAPESRTAIAEVEFYVRR